MRCLKCGHKMEIPDTKNYKSYEIVPDMPESKLNNYDHRWHWCPNCHSQLQTAAKYIPGTFTEGPDEAIIEELSLFGKKKESKK